jgi:hypothetical protein
VREGASRKAHVNVGEESDCGVVPMRRSNKGAGMT